MDPTGRGDFFARERQRHIVRLVEEHGRARVADLAAQFGVSTVTVRKDLAALEAAGHLTRTHGGAIALGSARPELAFDLRERLQRDEKALIGAAAAALVEDGETIAVDASTTGLSLVRQLKVLRQWSELTVVTNGIRIASELAGQRGITVLVPGGRLRWEALSFVGPWGDGMFRRINVQKAIVGAAGFSTDAGLSDATEEEAQIKRAMVNASREVIGIIDHTKWGKAAFATFCRTDRISRIVTDDQVAAAQLRAVVALGIPVTVASAAGTQEVLDPGHAQLRASAS